MNGAGKSIVGDAVGKIIGSVHYGHIQSPHDIEGEFTAAITNKVLILVDEAKISSEKDYNNIKNLVTGETSRVREMHKDPKYCESFLNLMFAGNNLTESIPGLDANARRFSMFYAAVLPLLRTPYMMAMYRDAMELPADHKIDEGVMQAWYFDMLYDSLYSDNNLGLRTLANFLYNIPVANFEHRKISVTKLLMKNKETSMHPIHSWWMEALRQNNLETSDKMPQWIHNPSQDRLFAKWTRSEEHKALTDKRNVRTYNKMKEFWDVLVGVLPTSHRISNEMMEMDGTFQLKKIVNGLAHDKCIEAFKSKYPGAEHSLDDELSEVGMDTMRADRVQGVNWHSYNKEFIPNPLNGKKWEGYNGGFTDDGLPRLEILSNESWLARVQDEEAHGYKVMSTYSKEKLAHMRKRCKAFKPSYHTDDQVRDRPLISINNNNVLLNL